MKQIFLLLVSLIYGQMLLAQSVELLQDSTWISIERQVTQTEMKPGWKIVDIQTRSRMIRYLWGRTARNYSDLHRPTLRVTPAEDATLADMGILRLQQKKEYRRIPKPELKDNRILWTDLSTFNIRAEDDSFIITPLQDLTPGEYIIIWRNQPTVGDYDDWTVWPICIK